MARTMTDIITDYKLLAKEMLGPDSVQEGMIKSLATSFNEFQLSNEQVGEVLAQLVVSTSAAFNKDALSAATDWDTKEAQAELIRRQVQGYDDNMLLKVVEHQAGLASFAVNAGSDDAQAAINSLLQKMVAVEARVPDLTGGQVCPTLPTVVPVPSNFTVTNVIATEVDLQWNNVINATDYLVYRDGVLIATTHQLSLTDTGLTSLTKYIYSVKASINGLESNYSNAIIATTL